MISNNITAAALASKHLELDPSGLQNWHDTEIPVDILDSPFFHADADVKVIKPALIFSHEAAEIDVGASSRLSSESAPYSRYSEVALTCRLYDLVRSSSVPAFETKKCGLRSSQLNVVRLHLAANSIKPGTYHFQLALESSVLPPVYSGGAVKVLSAPRLRSVYPRYLVADSMEHLDSLFLLGSDFGALASLDGSLKCVLVMEAENRTISSLLSSQSRNAEVLNDQVTRCPLSPSTTR